MGVRFTPSAPIAIWLNFKKRWITNLKEVTNEQMKLLIKNRIVFNSEKGFVDKNKRQIGFYRTRNKRYIEDKYVDIAKKLS